VRAADAEKTTTAEDFPVRTAGPQAAGRKFMIAFYYVLIAWLTVAARLGCETLPVPQTVTVTIGSAEVQVEIADTQAARIQGLSGRECLPENHGMLFVFDGPDRYAFWMKDTLMPLDFLWIRQGAVVQITENVQPADFQPPRTLSPRRPVDEVMELKAGTVKNLGIEVGDRMRIESRHEPP
jgi:uncharacterized membrane protein (UPF0127 family)